MSIQAMAWVLESSQSEGSARLVLLAIANHTDGHGYNAYPSIEQIGIEARVSRATVFRCLETLEAAGELEVRHSRGRKHRNIYRVPMKRSQTETFRWEDDVSENVSENVSSDAEKVSSAQEKGLTGATQNRPEPSKSLTRPSTNCRVCGDIIGEGEGRCRVCAEEGREVGWVAGEPLTGDERAAGLAALRRLRQARGYCPGDE